MGATFAGFSSMAESNSSDQSRRQDGLNINDQGQAHIQNLTQNFGVSAPEKRDRVEAILLDAVKTEVAGRQEYALHNRVYIELDKQEDPSHVVQPWEYDVKEGSAAAVRCPVNTQVMEIWRCWIELG